MPDETEPNPDLDALEEQWLKVKSRVREEFSRCLSRHAEIRPSFGDENPTLRQHGKNRRGAKNPPTPGRPEGISGQVPIEERVLFEPIGSNRYELVVPWQVLRKLQRLEYVPRFPIPGDAERRTAQRLFQIERQIRANEGDKMFGGPTLAWFKALAMRYLKLDRCYYVCKPPASSDKKAGKGLGKEDWEFRLDAAKKARQHDLAWACTIALKGMPEPISDFYVRPLFRLKKANGEFVRVVELINQHGEWFGPLEMDGDAMSTPSKLRPWISSRSSGSWITGEKELQGLLVDWASMTAFKEVEEVAAYGWHVPETKGMERPVPAHAWFSKNACIDDWGGLHQVDAKTGVFHIPVPKPGSPNEKLWRRYRMSATDREGTEFLVKSPEWHPEIATVEQKDVALLSFEFMHRLFQSIGGNEAYAMAGLTFAYAAGPEIFAKFGAFPGLWTAGRFGQGKTTVTEWAGEIYGIHGAVSLEQASVAGLELLLGQMSHLPPLFEEFQTGARDMVMSILKSTFNRTAVPKKLEKGARRPLTTPFVIGQATSGDPATRSRFLHVQVSSSKRLGSPEEQRANFDWMEANRKHFWKMGRFLLQNRRAFSRRLLEILADYLGSEEVKVIRDDRARKVHGVAYAGLVAAAEIFGLDKKLDHPNAHLRLPPMDQYVGMRSWFVSATETAVGEVNEQGELDVWWQKVITAVDRGDINSTNVRSMFTAVLKDELPVPPGCPKESSQGTWGSWHLRINHSALFDMMLEYARKQNEPKKLSKKDVRDQMRGRPGWVEQKRDARHNAGRHRFEGNNKPYWEVNLDEIEDIGYRQVSDEEHFRWKHAKLYRVPSDAGGTRMLVGILKTAMEAQEPDDPLPPLAAGSARLFLEDGTYLEGIVTQFERDHTWQQPPDPRKGGLYKIVEMLTRTSST